MMREWKGDVELTIFCHEWGMLSCRKVINGSKKKRKG